MLETVSIWWTVWFVLVKAANIVSVANTTKCPPLCQNAQLTIVHNATSWIDNWRHINVSLHRLQVMHINNKLNCKLIHPVAISSWLVAVTNVLINKITIINELLDTSDPILDEIKKEKIVCQSPDESWRAMLFPYIIFIATPLSWCESDN